MTAPVDGQGYGNRVRCYTSTTGTGTVTFGSAVATYQTPAQANVRNGSKVGYVLEQSPQFEVGRGVYNAAGGGTITRTIIESSSNSGNAITLDGTAIVTLTLTAATANNIEKADVAGPRKNGLLIPFYYYPSGGGSGAYTDTTIRRLMALIRRYHDVPVIVVLNPGNGPSTAPPAYVWDGIYASAIRLLKAAGATVVGYVSTAYATRAESAVKADVDAWNSLYADTGTAGHYTPVDGIFFDEMPYNTEHGGGAVGSDVLLYQRYYDYCHNRGFSLVIGNPGTNQQAAWYDTRTADIIVTWETSSWPVESDMAGNFAGGHVDYDWAFNSLLIHSMATFDEAQFQMVRQYVKWLYITEDLLAPDPWNTLSAYTERMFALCSDIGGFDLNYIYNAPITGFNLTLTAATTLLEPAGTLATGTLTFPAAPVDGALITVSSTKIITALTLAGNGKTIAPPVPTTIAAGGVLRYIFRGTNNTWYAR